MLPYRYMAGRSSILERGSIQMHNNKPLDVVRSQQLDYCKSQGGAVLEGKDGDPTKYAEQPPQGTGHSSAESAGVAGHEVPGGKMSGGKGY